MRWRGKRREDLPRTLPLNLDHDPPTAQHRDPTRQTAIYGRGGARLSRAMVAIHASTPLCAVRDTDIVRGSLRDDVDGGGLSLSGGASSDMSTA